MRLSNWRARCWLLRTMSERPSARDRVPASLLLRQRSGTHDRRSGWLYKAAAPDLTAVARRLAF
jgi:hypothetical protein